MDFKTTIGQLRFLAIAEGISYISFGITMPLKRIYNMPAPNYYVGMAHGVLFIAYILFCLISYKKYNWSFKKLFLAGIASLIPFGTFVADVKLFKETK